MDLREVNTGRGSSQGRGCARLTMKLNGAAGCASARLRLIPMCKVIRALSLRAREQRRVSSRSVSTGVPKNARATVRFAEGGGAH